MAYTVKENMDGRLVLVAANGNFARTTESKIFSTTNRATADLAAAFINQDVGAGERKGPHWLKSTFGT
jgi:hypothetical protein